MATSKKKKPVTKSEIGKELEEKVKKSQIKFNRSQQEILRKMKEKKEEEYDKKFQDSLKRAFSVSIDEEGTTLLDEIASKTASVYANMETVGIKDAINLSEALGENKKSVDVQVGGKINIQEELKKLAVEDEWD